MEEKGCLMMCREQKTLDHEYFLADEETYLSSLNEFKNRYGLNKNGICIGYMGDSRSFKGFHLLPELVRNVLAKTYDIYFAIQCPKFIGAKSPLPLRSRAVEAHEKP